MNIVIPAAGRGQRFRDAGHLLPKPLIDVAGKTMISRVIASLLPSGEHRVIAAVPPGTPEMYDVEQVVINKTTDGAARTVALAIHMAQLDLNEPLLVSNSDQIVDFDIGEFLRMAHGHDGSLVVFHAPDGSPKWSYARTRQRRVLEVAEKRPISEYATAGIYYWTRTADFLYSATEMIEADDRTNREFYVAPTYNYMVRDGASITSYIVPAAAFHSMGTPEDLATYVEYLKEKVDA